MSNMIDDEKLKRAKEQLACHIEPPKPGQPVPSASERIRLTEMTAAGG